MIQRIVAALADWLRVQIKRGLIELDEVEEATGMLLGLVASALRCAAMFGNAALPSRSKIEARMWSCAALFLRGCQVRGIPARLLATDHYWHFPGMAVVSVNVRLREKSRHRI